MWRVKPVAAFALYEVMIGVTIFALGVITLGRSVENCITASMLTSEENRIRQILANRMAEVQATPGAPEPAKTSKIDSGYGEVVLQENTAPAELKGDDGSLLTGVHRVVLAAKWARGGTAQTREIAFYVYRN